MFYPSINNKHVVIKTKNIFIKKKNNKKVQEKRMTENKYQNDLVEYVLRMKEHNRVRAKYLREKKKLLESDKEHMVEHLELENKLLQSKVEKMGEIVNVLKNYIQIKREMDFLVNESEIALSFDLI